MRSHKPCVQEVVAPRIKVIAEQMATHFKNMEDLAKLFASAEQQLDALRGKLYDKAGDPGLSRLSRPERSARGAQLPMDDGPFAALACALGMFMTSNSSRHKLYEAWISLLTGA